MIMSLLNGRLHRPTQSNRPWQVLGKSRKLKQHADVMPCSPMPRISCLLLTAVRLHWSTGPLVQQSDCMRREPLHATIALSVCCGKTAHARFRSHPRIAYQSVVACCERMLEAISPCVLNNNPGGCRAHRLFSRDMITKKPSHDDVRSCV